ncbi:MAG TPA: DUF3617 domain-containing protein [Bryobacteraceae bacterium]
MKTTILIGAAMLCGWTAATAQEVKPFDAKPGLWEYTSKAEAMNAPAMPQIPEEVLRNMPPERRAQVEAMMKERAAGPPATTTKVCITRESLSRPLSFGQDKSCTQKVVSASSTKQEIHVECNRGNTNSSGDMTVERVDAEHAKGSGTVKLGQGDKAYSAKMSFTARWMSADCGDVKPMGEK